jgi:homoserine O-acetyltransferase/O-succinyltransferase
VPTSNSRFCTALLFLFFFGTDLQSAAAIDIKEGDYLIEGLQFRSGETLPELRLHYRTIGKAIRDAQGHISNAVLMLHATGSGGQQFLRPQFADVLFQTGGILDPANYFIVLPDDIGHGRSSKPSDGLHARFPQYDYFDMVEAEYQLVVNGFGIQHLRLVMGTSMGCMHAFIWAEIYPEFMDAVMPLACLPVPIAGRNRIWRKMIIDAIQGDPAWAGGEYHSEPRQALQTAADIMLIATSAPRQLQNSCPNRAAADQFLEQHALVAFGRLDANDLLYQLKASSDYDASAVDKIVARVIWVNSADDFINPPELEIAQRQAEKLKNGRFELIPISDQTYGHGTYARAALWKDYLQELLTTAPVAHDSVGPARTPRAP